ncbi:MAG: AEC family transporter [Oscillospiraceae bacterium]|jgi:predicted permease
MVESFFEVASQVFILFLLVAVGVACGKIKMLNHNAVKGIADFVLAFVIPCVIIQSFQREFDASMLAGLGIATLAALAVHGLGILLAHLIFHDKNEARRRVLRFSVVFSNAAYMSLPLQQALLGEDGVFYGAAYVAIFNLLLWSYGLVTMSGDKEALAPKKLIFNPGVVSIVIGLALFLGSVTLPEIIRIPIGHLASLNTPLPMIIVGFYLADAHILKALKDVRAHLCMLLRLIVIPLATLGGLWLCGVRGTLMVSVVVAASAPVAAASTMFSTKFDQDTELSVNLVSISTLFSIITMPLIVSLAQMLA